MLYQTNHSAESKTVFRFGINAIDFVYEHEIRVILVKIKILKISTYLMREVKKRDFRHAISGESLY